MTQFSRRFVRLNAFLGLGIVVALAARILFAGQAQPVTKKKPAGMEPVPALTPFVDAHTHFDEHDADGTIRFNIANGTNTALSYYSEPLTGFDAKNNPVWGTAQLLASTTLGSTDHTAADPERVTPVEAFERVFDRTATFRAVPAGRAERRVGRDARLEPTIDAATSPGTIEPRLNSTGGISRISRSCAG